MREELDNALCKDFPLLFSDRNGSEMETCMCWGFPGAGWEPLIRRAAEEIEPILQKMKDDGLEYPRASQVKEKYGTLRFYMTGYTDEIYEIVSRAEDESERTCEECGEPGKMRTHRYWHLTLCDKHNIERDL